MVIGLLLSAYKPVRIGGVPADRVFDAVACCGAIVILATFIPSKMFEYLAAGKAVVGLVSGEAPQILHEAGGDRGPSGG